MNQEINILFLGDIVGRPGRFAVKHFLENTDEILGYKPDVVIANCENASHGFGLTERNYKELISYGIDALTSGNHIWDRKEIFNYIDNAEKLIRPYNYPENTPGKGSMIIEKDGFSIGIINLLGRTFMDPYNSPWEVTEAEIINIKSKTSMVLIDFHAEATAEKIALGYYLSKLGITAFLGTHTHVQTADEKIIDNTTAYISDVGFCGSTESVIGMDISSSISKLKNLLPVRYEIPDIGQTTVNGVVIKVDTTNGSAKEIKRINVSVNLKQLIEDGLFETSKKE